MEKAFGEPESALAIPVSLKLAQDEVRARQKVRGETGLVASTLQRAIMEMRYSVQLFIAEQVNQVDEKLMAHQVALESSNHIVQETVEVAPRMSAAQSKFDRGMASLRARKNKLLHLFQEVSGVFGEKVDEMVDQVLIPASQQSTLPTPIAA